MEMLMAMDPRLCRDLQSSSQSSSWAITKKYLNKLKIRQTSDIWEIIIGSLKCKMPRPIILNKLIY